MANLQDIVNRSEVGAIKPWTKAAAPAGYLLCNGGAVSRSTYADLFAVVSTTYGSGDGSTTFNLPDLRGEFIRGFDNGKGTDSGRTFGSSQTYSTALPNNPFGTSNPGNHNHSYVTNQGTGGGQGGGGGQSQTNNYGGQAGGNCTAPQGHCHGRSMRGGTGCGGGEDSTSGDRTNWPCVVYGGGTWCSAAGGNGCNGAGGGSGYYGGGGGGSNPNSSPGGGGSGYVGGHPNHPVTSTNTYTGNYSNIHPAANSSPHYTPGIGNGGRSNGQNGRVVIVYEAFQAV